MSFILRLQDSEKIFYGHDDIGREYVSVGITAVSCSNIRVNKRIIKKKL